MNRPTEIEEAMDVMDDCTLEFSNTSIDAWNIIYSYIVHLKYVIQQMIAEEERKIDDGK